MTATIQVLLYTEDPAQQRRWTRMLSDARFRVFERDELACCGVDIVVTDRPIAAPDEQQIRGRVPLGEIGIIAVGTDAPASVWLPPSFAGRELRVASLLLGQVVRLKRDRQEHLQARDRLARQAFCDPLTGLPNRRAYEEELSRRTRGLEHESSNLYLLLLDLDSFKAVNDGLGHTAGDEALQLAARALNASIRSDDFAARLGGDEFAVFISDLASEAAMPVVERIRRSIADLSDGRVTASVGYASITSAQSVAGLFEAADEALRQAKQAGRDRAVAARQEQKKSSGI